MATFWCVLVALALNLSGFYTFRKAEDYDSFPHVTYLIFLGAVFFLLWDSCIYPQNFRRLYPLCEYVIEFCIILFLMEFIIVDFCLPLEKQFVNSVVPAVIKLIEQLTEMIGLNVGAMDDMTETLKSADAQAASSYACSIAFCLIILHGTRAIDLRILQCRGLGAFVSDVQYRTECFYTSIISSIFKDNCNSRNRGRGRKRNCFTLASLEFEENSPLPMNNDNRANRSVNRRSRKKPTSDIQES